jgi:formylglycine-generating enzyme required for sulfatase activity
LKLALFLMTSLIALVFCSCGEDSPNIFHIDIVSYLDEGRDIEMVSLPGGTYAMGSALYPAFTMEPIGIGGALVRVYNFERPVHIVSVSPFLISNTEITHEQYRAVMGLNPSKFSGMADMPVESIKWQEAADFCNELSGKMGLNPCYDQSYNCDLGKNGFRLPTEAEWEFAARGGTDLEYSFGDGAAGLVRNGWYLGNSGSKPSPVAYKEPNQYGLYDMHGNVSEWCQDMFAFYNCGAQSDPVVTEGAPVYVARGGNWASVAKDCRSAARRAYYKDRAVSLLGFRIVRRQ